MFSVVLLPATGAFTKLKDRTVHAQSHATSTTLVLVLVAVNETALQQFAVVSLSVSHSLVVNNNNNSSSSSSNMTSQYHKNNNSATTNRAMNLSPRAIKPTLAQQQPHQSRPPVMGTSHRRASFGFAPPQPRRASLSPVPRRGSMSSTFTTTTNNNSNSTSNQFMSLFQSSTSSNASASTTVQMDDVDFKELQQHLAAHRGVRTNATLRLETARFVEAKRKERELNALADASSSTLSSPSHAPNQNRRWSLLKNATMMAMPRLPLTTTTSTVSSSSSSSTRPSTPSSDTKMMPTAFASSNSFMNGSDSSLPKLDESETTTTITPLTSESTPSGSWETKGETNLVGFRDGVDMVVPLNGDDSEECHEQRRHGRHTRGRTKKSTKSTNKTITRDNESHNDDDAFAAAAAAANKGHDENDKLQRRQKTKKDKNSSSSSKTTKRDKNQGHRIFQSLADEAMPKYDGAAGSSSENPQRRRRKKKINLDMTALSNFPDLPSMPSTRLEGSFPKVRRMHSSIDTLDTEDDNEQFIDGLLFFSGEGERNEKRIRRLLLKRTMSGMSIDSCSSV